MGLERLRAGTEGGHGRQVLKEALLLPGGHCAGDTAVLFGLVLWDPPLSGLQFLYLQGWIKLAAMRQARS